METMSPELINRPYQLSPSTSSSSQENSTVLISLVLVHVLRFVIASFLGEKNHLYSNGVEPRKNIADVNGVDSYHGINSSVITRNSLDGNRGALVYGESRGFWNGLNLPSTIPEVILALQFFRTFFNLLTDVVNLVLNKYRLDRETIEELNKVEEPTTQSYFPHKKSRALRILKPSTKSHYNKQAISSAYLTTLASKVESAIEKTSKI